MADVQNESPIRSSDDDIGVLIVDDQAPFRAVARTVVDLSPGFVVVGEVETAEDAVTAVVDVAPQVVLMDINLPGMSGIEATRLIVADEPSVAVVLLSTYTERDLPADASTCGARAYVHKEDFSPSLLRALWDDPGGHSTAAT